MGSSRFQCIVAWFDVNGGCSHPSCKKTVRMVERQLHSQEQVLSDERRTRSEGNLNKPQDLSDNAEDNAEQVVDA
jgi:hypothetical protein